MPAIETPASLRRCGLAFVVALTTVGCGDSAPYKLASVSGIVTLDGKPVPYTQIVFLPQGSEGNINPGPGSTANCDDAGRFDLKTVRGEAGAVVGAHAVQIYAHGPPRASSASDTDVGPKPKELFPPQFNASSTLTFDVPAEGTTAANFELTSKP